MKKLFALFAFLGLFMTVSLTNVVMAQEDDAIEEVVAEDDEAVEETSEVGADDAAAAEEEDEAPIAAAPAQDEKPKTIHQAVKEKFIEGGPLFMASVLICLILGLAICIERIIYLNMATSNTRKLLEEVEAALKSGGVDAAKEVCRNTRGPVASIFYQGLERSPEGLEMVEKSVVAYGSVQMGLLEKGLSWISLFVALAPMLGFLGTVIGMIDAFDAIQRENNISPAIVAGGIKVALITTVSGLIVAIILQIFYNYIVSKVDNIVNDMEDSSISLIDMMVRNGLK